MKENCTYCHGEGENIAGSWTGLEIVGSNRQITAWGDGAASLLINFCPVCGRDLRSIEVNEHQLPND